MTLPQQLQSNASLIEARLERILTQDMPPTAPPRLVEAMRYAVLGGGKRFRPFLTIESAKLFGLQAESALDAAAAIELLHCYSLVHDDLPAMDDDDLRRGRPTVHIAFDEATAILAGDSLLTLSFEVLARPDAHPDPTVRCELAVGLARASGTGGMAGGQQLDLEAESSPKQGAADLEQVRNIQEKKTGALIAFSAEAGAIIAGATAEDRTALLKYGRCLGGAFQIADDLLDVEGSADTVGKATGKDAAAGKATYVSALGIEGARARLRELEAAAHAALEPFGSRATTLRQAIDFVSNRTS
ncbi:polyprenyl synthetase family protein [Leptospira interrogans]